MFSHSVTHFKTNIILLFSYSVEHFKPNIYFYCFPTQQHTVNQTCTFIVFLFLIDIKIVSTVTVKKEAEITWGKDMLTVFSVYVLLLHPWCVWKGGQLAD